MKCTHLIQRWTVKSEHWYKDFLPFTCMKMAWEQKMAVQSWGNLMLKSRRFPLSLVHLFFLSISSLFPYEQTGVAYFLRQL